MTVVFARADAQDQAAGAWERVIAAKGGRARLRAVTNLQRSSRIPSKIGFHSFDRKREELLVFPNRYWGWTDQRPTVFGVHVVLFDISKGYRYYAFDGNGPARRSVPDPRQRWDLDVVQAVDLIETTWFTPKPMAVESARQGRPNSAQLIRCEVVLGGDEAEAKYEIDELSSLPTRIVLRQRSGHPSFTNQYTYDILEYEEVDGLKLPRRVRVHGGGPTYDQIIRHQVNVAFDSNLFSRPPSVEDGPEAWKPTASSSGRSAR